MKRLFVIGLVWVAGALTAVAQDEFSKTVQPQDFAAAGLGKLSPQELVRLNELVNEFKSGALAAARREVVAAEEARAAAEVKANQAETSARVAKAEMEKEKVKQTEPGFFSKAKVLLRAGTQVEYTAIESRIVGDFTGWQGRATFVLENGQRWQVANGGSYITPPISSPKVTVTPSAVGGYWMTIEGMRQKVKVVPLEAGK